MAIDPVTSLHYLIRGPLIKSEKPPVVILLHGVGSNEEDLFAFAREIPGNYLVVSLRAPITLGPDSYAWYPVDFSSGKPVYDLAQEEKSRLDIIQFISDLKSEHAFDEKQVYLCGFSQGAIMSYSVALTRPDLIKGIAVMSGRLLEEIKPMIKKKDELQQLKVFISHGTADPTLTIRYAQNAAAYLKTLNIIPVYKEYQAGHTINTAMLADLILWLRNNQ